MAKHFVIWLIIVFTFPIMAPVVMTPKSLSLFIRDDYNAAINILGGKSELNTELKSLYRSTLKIIADFANDFDARDDDSQRYRDSGDHIGEAIADMPARWATMVKLQAYSLALRLIIVAKWSPWLGGPLILAAAAGFLQRQLKAATFSPPLPPVYNTVAHGMLALMAFLVLWVASPIPLPLAAIPVISTLLCVFLNLAVTHYPNYA
jgi:hypothetical protein